MKNITIDREKQREIIVQAIHEARLMDGDHYRRDTLTLINAAMAQIDAVVVQPAKRSCDYPDVDEFDKDDRLSSTVKAIQAMAKEIGL